jgi:transposase
VVRGGGSWREIPVAWEKWETAYRRYRLWCDTGLWQRILAVLEDSDREVSL